MQHWCQAAKQLTESTSLSIAKTHELTNHMQHIQIWVEWILRTLNAFPSSYEVFYTGKELVACIDILTGFQ